MYFIACLMKICITHASEVGKALSRFGLANFGPGSFRPIFVGRFGLIFSKSLLVRYDRLNNNLVV